MDDTDYNDWLDTYQSHRLSFEEWKRRSSETIIQSVGKQITGGKHYEPCDINDKKDVAVVWNRLYSGTQVDRDILLLNHELLESGLEKEYDLELAEAHKRANLKRESSKKKLHGNDKNRRIEMIGGFFIREEV